MAEPITAEALLELRIGSHWFIQDARRATPEVIRGVLAVPPDRDNGDAVFLHAVVRPDLSDDELVAAWRKALQALGDLGVSYSWGSAKLRAKLEGVANDPDLLAAAQAAAAGSTDVSRALLAVLAIDSTEGSLDAFLPHFSKAMMEGGDAIDWLAKVRKHVPPDSGFLPLLDRVDAVRAARNAVSPALALADLIGVGPTDVFWFGLSVGSTRLTPNNVPEYQASVQVDSRSEAWFGVSVTHVLHRENRGFPSTSFGPEGVYDDLGLGSCPADAIPHWFAAAARTLDITWDPDDLSIRTSARGQQRERIVSWLLGGYARSGR